MSSPNDGESEWGWCDIHGGLWNVDDGGCTDCMTEWTTLEVGDPRIPGNEEENEDIQR